MALTEMPTTFEEHPSVVAERAYNSVLKDVLPGIRHMMRSGPMRSLEIENPEGWARREHAKSLLAAKAAAAAAAREVEVGSGRNCS